MFPDRKSQVMFPSHLCQQISAVACFRYISANGFLISLLSLQKQQTGDGFMNQTIFFYEIHRALEFIDNIIRSNVISAAFWQMKVFGAE